METATTMQLMPVNTALKVPVTSPLFDKYSSNKEPSTQDISTPPDKVRNSKRKHFIEANTTEVSISHLQSDCVVPVFSKDNEITISHTNFIQTVQEAAYKFFAGETIETPEIMVSHIVKGRIPDAIYKPVNELLESDKTIYYERMAFCFEIPTIYEDINGNRLICLIGGEGAINIRNLYARNQVENSKSLIGSKSLEV